MSGEAILFRSDVAKYFKTRSLNSISGESSSNSTFEKMSLNDKILEIYEEREHLSTEDVTRILKEKYQIDRNPRTIQRHVTELIKQGELAPDKPRGREQTYSVAQPPAYGKPTSLWDRLKLTLEQVGSHLVEITREKASFAGRDPETGWRVHDHDTEDSIKGIMVLKSAARLVNTARSSQIYIEDKYSGAVLTSDPIGFMGRLFWKNKLYAVKDVDEKLDGYDFSFYVAKLDELPLGKEEKAHVPRKTLPPGVFDPRKEIRALLTTNLSKTNMLKNNDFEAAYCVIYTGPPYDIVKEFRASNSPVDGVFAIGEPYIKPLFSGSQTPWGHEIRVPIFIFTIDKVGVTGTKLKWVMEAELRRVSETFHVAHGAHMQLEKHGDRDKRRGSIVLHSTEYILRYERSVSP